MSSTEAPTTLPEAVEHAARRWPHRVAWVFDPGETLTFAQVERRVAGAARGLLAAGISSGDRVAVMLPNRAEFAVTWLALASIGASIVPLNVRYRDEDAGFILGRSRAVALVSSDDVSGALRSIDIRRLDAVDIAGPGVDGDALPPVSRDPDSVVNVQFTSGTTGHPKGCLLSHRYWLTLATGIVDGFPRINADDTMLTAQAMSYMDPLWNLAGSLVSGARLVVLDGFHSSSFWAKVREHDVTYFYCLASMPAMLLSTPPTPHDRDHRVRVIQCSAIPPRLHADLERRWGAPWYEVFGMTETGGDIHVTELDHDLLVGTGSIGKPKPGREARIVDADDQPLPAGAVGELLVRGPGMMTGYDDEPDATAAALRGGWMHTGDLARRDDDGNIFLVGRLKDVVRRGGENIAAREVEDVLLSHPLVRMAALVSVPDPLRGEEAKAYVVLVESLDSEAAASVLAAHCAAHLAAFKVPRFWEVREDLPRTPSERVAKAEIVPGRTWDAVEGAWIDREVLMPWDDVVDRSTVRGMYEESFGADLAAPWQQIEHPRGDEELLVLVSGTHPLGFALVRHLGSTGMTFVRYLAVSPHERGRGHGGTLWQLLEDHLRAAGVTHVLLDLEDPDAAADPRVRAEDERRISFYERLGVRPLAVPGYAPPAHGTSGEQVAMLLLGRTLSTSGEPLEGAVLDAAAEAVYRYRYGVDGPS